jgi:hypothetical protein
MNKYVVVSALLVSTVAIAPAVHAAGAGVEIDPALHTLVVAQGEVSVKRKGWTGYAPAGFGTAMRRGDLIRLGASAHATVTCADLVVRELPAGKISGVPCVAGQAPLLVYEGSLLSPTRAVSSADIPVVIAPRRTKVLSPRPTLRWQAIEGVKSFQLRVSGPGVSWSATARETTTLVYPADAPALAAGSTYKVSVIAGGRNSDEFTEPGLGFTVLDAAAAQKVRAEAERIQGLELPDESKQLLRSQLYAARDLHAEATEQLETLAKSRDAAAVRLALGRQYQSVGLSELAEQNYRKAAQQAAAANDVEGQALALQSLGYLYRDTFGLPADARESFSGALPLFRKLGAAATTKEIEHALAQDGAH